MVVQRQRDGDGDLLGASSPPLCSHRNEVPGLCSESFKSEEFG